MFKLFKELNPKNILGSSLNSAKIDLAAGCLTSYASRLSATKLLILYRLSKYLVVDSSIKSKEKRKYLDI